LDRSIGEIEQYLWSFYFITSTVLTVGFGDIHAITISEVYWMICMELLGCFAYSFVSSKVVSILVDPAMNTFLTRHNRLYSAFKRRGVSEESLHEMIRYQEFVWERDRDRDDFYELWHRMPESLRKRIALAVHMPVFQKLERLSETAHAMLAEVAFALKPRIFTPGDFLIKAGRVSPVMIFLVEGVVAILRPSGEVVENIDANSGTIIGEASVIDGVQETVSVVACTYLEAFELSKEDFDRIGLVEELNGTKPPQAAPVTAERQAPEEEISDVSSCD
jgi:hypothetical protein